MTRPTVLHADGVSWVRWSDGTSASVRGPMARVRAVEIAHGGQVIDWLRPYVDLCEADICATGKVRPLPRLIETELSAACELLRQQPQAREHIE